MTPETTSSENAKCWLIVVPVFYSVLPKAFYNFFAMAMRTGRDLYPDGYSFVLMQAERQILHMAMNKAADAVLEHGYAGILAFDDDCLPPADCITSLIRHHEAGHEFVAAMGYMRNYPHTTTVGKYYPEGPTLIGSTGEVAPFYWLDALPHRSRGLIEADFCGVPAMLLSRTAIARMQKPVFGTTDASGGQMTHDVFMCRRLQDAGIKVMVDTAIECGHITEAPVVDSVTREAARLAVRVNAKAEAAAKIEQVPA